jgi:protein disulfide-isomerase
MNKLIVVAALALMAAVGGAAPAPAAVWLTDLPQAQTLAKAQHELLLLDFTGSDWCPGCIDLKKHVLDNPAFLAYAATNVVLVEVDFPDKKVQPDTLKKANEKLSEQYNIEVFPTLVILDANGKVVGRQEGYAGEDVAVYISALDKIRTAKGGAGK